MGIFDIFKSKKRKEKEDKEAELFIQKMEAMMDQMKEAEGTELDELPNGEGEFGFSRNNPILLSGIPESREYLERLLYLKPGSSRYRWNRWGSVKSDIVDTPVDMYNLLNPEEEVVSTIYIWPYNKVTSKKIPEGFTFMEY